MLFKQIKADEYENARVYPLLKRDGIIYVAHDTDENDEDAEKMGNVQQVVHYITQVTNSTAQSQVYSY